MVDTVKTHFVCKGETGPAVVLVHGFGSSTFTWQKTITALAGKHRVYALDLKGFGLSAKPKDGQYNLEVYTNHLLGFLDVMKLERPAIVAHSLGGAIAARMALLHPERVRALVLEDPMPLVLPKVTDTDLLRKAGVNLGKGPIEPGSAAETAAILNPFMAKAMLPTLIRSTITRQTIENGLKVGYHDPKFVTPELIEVVYRPLLFDGATEALASMLVPQPPEPKPLPGLETLKMPTLVAWGEHDRVVSTTLYEQYAGSIPGAIKVVFANSGHVPHEEEADDFNLRLLGFLDQRP